MVRDRRLKVCEEHRRAVERYASAALFLAEPAWSAPWRAGAWSPAQITQHVIQAYEVASSELSGGSGARARVGPIMSTLLRWFLLPHVLFHRKLPRAAAPVETRPSGHPGDPSTAVERMRELAKVFEGLTAAPDAPPALKLRHPYFGPLSPYQALRLMSLHTEHHARQLEAAANPASPS